MIRITEYKYNKQFLFFVMGEIESVVVVVIIIIIIIELNYYS